MDFFESIQFGVPSASGMSKLTFINFGNFSAVTYLSDVLAPPFPGTADTNTAFGHKAGSPHLTACSLSVLQLGVPAAPASGSRILSAFSAAYPIQ